LHRSGDIRKGLTLFVAASVFVISLEAATDVTGFITGVIDEAVSVPIGVIGLTFGASVASIVDLESELVELDVDPSGFIFGELQEENKNNVNHTDAILNSIRNIRFPYYS